jgi:hypothetical protein
MFSIGAAVWYYSEQAGWWPARVIDAVDCLRGVQFIRLYQLKIFGEDMSTAPTQSKLFA